MDLLSNLYEYSRINKILILDSFLQDKKSEGKYMTLNEKLMTMNCKYLTSCEVELKTI